MKSVTDFFLSGGKADEDASFLGFSFPFISDSIMDEIELLKKKWLPKYWTSQNDIELKEEKGSKIKVRPKFHYFIFMR